MSAQALLVELAAVGIHLVKEGERLRVRGKRGATFDRSLAQIQRYKPQLLALLSRAPDGWDGTLPETRRMPNPTPPMRRTPAKTLTMLASQGASENLTHDGSARRDSLPCTSPPGDPALLKASLQAEILEAAQAGAAFDPEGYITLWRRYHALGGRMPICDACHWPDLCRVLGPRAPQLPGGPCAAWPADAVAHDSNQDEPAIAGVLPKGCVPCGDGGELMQWITVPSGETFDLDVLLEQIEHLGPEDLEAYRNEVAAASDDDPLAAVDRAALSRFDRQSSRSTEVSA